MVENSEDLRVCAQEQVKLLHTDTKSSFGMKMRIEKDNREQRKGCYQLMSAVFQ
ncbi:hypothetical protein E2C01_047219 [Portunus trituberculatus]|uniref:Uncharacterized protein n=1 Tax=Portunus trituberculatus TaxID=210409 RepID=A0A5B7FZV3_PORTR|nr:hypothetical protein [Portunus trituberculatus]